MRVTELWAIVHDREFDKQGGKGGIVATMSGTGWLPMVAVDEATLRRNFLPTARRLATQTGERMMVARFGARIDVEEIEP